jgi:hypothetical protein
LIPIDKLYSCIILIKICLSFFHYPLKQQFCQPGTAGSGKKFSVAAQFEIPQLISYYEKLFICYSFTATLKEAVIKKVFSKTLM